MHTSFFEKNFHDCFASRRTDLPCWLRISERLARIWQELHPSSASCAQGWRGAANAERSAVYVVEDKNLSEPWFMELKPDFAGENVQLAAFAIFV